MVGWYERTNLAGNMLDVLINSPGEPINWSENLSIVRVPGLRSPVEPYVDYNRVKSLFEGARSGNTALLGALWNLSGLNNFKLVFYFVNSSVSANYSLSISSSSLLSPPAVLEICSLSQVNVLPNSTSIVIHCPSGVFYFSHSGVSYSYYGNPYSVCVLNSAFVGNNFEVYVGQTFSINGSLSVASDGTVNTSSLYVNGNLSVANSGLLTASSVAYVNGSLYIAGAGNVADVGELYVYGDTFVGNSGFLNTTGSAYILGNTRVSSYGVINIGGSLYEYSNLSLFNGASITVGGYTYVGGNLVASGSAYLTSGNSVYISGNASISSSKISTGGSVYINGPLYVGYGGVINASGDVYINGNVVLYGQLVARNIYINGSLTVGWGGEVDASENIVVNGTVYSRGSIYSGNTTVVFGNLILTGGTGLNANGSLYVGGNISSIEPVSVGNVLVAYQYVHMNSTLASLTVGSDAYIGYQLYSNGSITVNGNLYVYYIHGYYYVVYTLFSPDRYYYYGVILGPAGKNLKIDGGRLYFIVDTVDDQWHALEGYFYSDSDFDMNAYRLTPFGQWLSETVDVTNEDKDWFIYTSTYFNPLGRSYEYIAPIHLVSYSQDYVTATILIDPGNSPLVVPPSSLPAYPAFANISPATWIYSLPPLPTFQLATCSVSQTAPSLELNVTFLNVSYVYPSLSQLGASYFQVSMVNGSLVNESVANNSMASASWVEQASRVVAVRMLLYSKEYNITSSLPLPRALYGGMLQFAPIGYLKVEVPESTGNFTLVSTYVGEGYSGYSILAIASINGSVAYGFSSSNINSCNIHVSGTTLLVPWKCFIPFNGVNDKVTFTLWAYSIGGYNWAYIEDMANMNIYMRPVYTYAVVKVLVWR